MIISRMIYFTVIITIAILDYELVMDTKYKNECINLKNTISVKETDPGHQHQAQVKIYLVMFPDPH